MNRRVHAVSILEEYDIRVYSERRIYLIIFAAIILVLVVGAVWYVAWGQGVSNVATVFAGPTATFTNAQFNYSFTYPSKYKAQQLAPEFVSIGPVQNGSIEGQANVAVLHAKKSEPLPNAESFVRLTAGLACNQGASVSCTSVAQAGPFTTSSGLKGEELYFDSNAGKRGPFIAFDISKSIPGEYAVLLIYPPASLAQNDADRSLLTTIAQSVQIR